MNSEFQDSRINPDNLRLYQEIPEQDLVKNVNPRGQRWVIQAKRHIHSLSPEIQQAQLIKSMLLTRPAHQLSTKNSTAVNFNSTGRLPKNNSISSSQSSQLFPSIVGHGSTTTNLLQPQQKSIGNFGSEKKLYINIQQGVEDKIFEKQGFHSPMNRTASSNFASTNYSTADKSDGLLIEDKRVSHKTVRSEFIKQKFESLMKNTFCLRNKHTRGGSVSPENYSEFHQYNVLSYQNSATPSITSTQQPSMLGIFMQNNKTITATSQLLTPMTAGSNEAYYNNSKKKKNQYNNVFDPSKSRYDKIYKMMELQDPSQRIYSDGNQGQDNMTNPFNNSPFGVQPYGLSQLNQQKYNPKSTNFDFAEQLEHFPVKRPRTESQDCFSPLELLGVKKKTLQARPSFLAKNKQDNISNSESLQSLPLLPWQISQQQSQQLPGGAIKQIFNQSQDITNQSLDEVPSPINAENKPRKKSSFTIGMIHQGANQLHKPSVPIQNSASRNGSDQMSQDNSNFNKDDSIQEIQSSKYSLKSIRSLKRVDEANKSSSNKLIDIKNTNSSCDVEIEEEDDENDEGNPTVGIQNLFNQFKEGEATPIVMRKNQSRKHTQQPSISIKVTQALSDEDEDGFGAESRKQMNSTEILGSQEQVNLLQDNEQENSKDQEQSPEPNLDSDGFVMKKTIDFSQLKELRDKTINRLNGMNSVRKAPQLKIVISQDQGSKSRMSSDTPGGRKLNTPTPSKRDILSPDSTVKSKFNLQPDKEKSFFSSGQSNSSRQHKQSSNSSSENLKVFDKSGDNTPQSSLFKEKDKILRKEQSLDDSTNKSKKKQRQDGSVQSSLKSYFRKTAQRKKKTKTQEKEEQNKEEQQRIADKQIALKLEEVKDKVKAGVKLVIRDQIQKRLVSTLSQAALNLNVNNNNNNNLNNSIISNINSSRSVQLPSSINSPLKNTPKVANNNNNGTANQSFFGSAFKAQQQAQQLQNSSGSGAPNRVNPTYEEQQREVAEYSSAIMNFFDACIDNLNEKPGAFNHDFSLRGLKNFNETMSENLVKTFEVEMKKQNMSTESVERFRYIYEINTKMHLFYSGLVQMLGGIEKVKNLIEEVVRKVSSHVTMFPINHVYSFEVMNRRIIPGLCALLCDDQSLFLSTLRYFLETNQSEHLDFSFIDFFFIKKVLFSVLTNKKIAQISTPLALSIMQKIESVRRYVFPIHVLADDEVRQDITNSLFECESFLVFFHPQLFKKENLRSLLDHLFDYFYADSDDKAITDFTRFTRLLKPLLLKKLSRKVIDFIELFTQQALEEERYTLQVVIRDLHYKFTKVRLKLGFNQGIFGVFKFEQNEELLKAIGEEIEDCLSYCETNNFSEVEIAKLQDLSFLKYYMRFLLSEFDIFSVYDFSVAMPYFGVTHKVFAFWTNCLRSVLLTKYGFQPKQADQFIRFVEACCTSV